MIVRERLVVLVTWHGFYIAVRPRDRFYRFAFFARLVPWRVRLVLERS